MNIDVYKEKIKEKVDCPCSLIHNVFNLREVNETLNDLYDIKVKKLNM